MKFFSRRNTSLLGQTSRNGMWIDEVTNAYLRGASSPQTRVPYSPHYTSVQRTSWNKLESGQETQRVRKLSRDSKKPFCNRRVPWELHILQDGRTPTPLLTQGLLWRTDERMLAELVCKQQCITEVMYIALETDLITPTMLTWGCCLKQLNFSLSALMSQGPLSFGDHSMRLGGRVLAGKTRH